MTGEGSTGRGGLQKRGPTNPSLYFQRRGVAVRKKKGELGLTGKRKFPQFGY